MINILRTVPDPGTERSLWKSMYMNTQVAMGPVNFDTRLFDRKLDVICAHLALYREARTALFKEMLGGA